mmetsp:Transcript_135091/g.419796  ORF Transcript_135091/g.419796 Transcript_135091/m.419796 type:complete len:229 (-) Transcript_135091:592-1278(-)
MRNSLVKYSIWSAYMGQFSNTRESEQVRLTTPLRRFSVVERGTTCPRASMLCMATPTSVRRSISLSSSWLQSTAWVFGVRDASMGARVLVPLQGAPRTIVTPGMMAFSLTLFQVLCTKSSSKLSAPLAGCTPSRSARLQGMRESPGSFFNISCISEPKKALICMQISSKEPPPLPAAAAARSSASARVKSSSSGLAMQGTRYSRNSTCFRLWGKPPRTKFCTPSAMPR